MKNKPNSTVYLSNLSYERDRNGIKSLLRSFGSIVSIKIIVEPTSGQSRGMAFVEMKTLEEANKVIEGLNGQIIDGRTLKVNYAIPQKDEGKIKSKTQKSLKREKDLEYKDIQLAKKMRNDKKRKSKEIAFSFKKKAPVKK